MKSPVAPLSQEKDSRSAPKGKGVRAFRAAASIRQGATIVQTRTLGTLAATIPGAMEQGQDLQVSFSIDCHAGLANTEVPNAGVAMFNDADQPYIFSLCVC